MTVIVYTNTVVTHDKTKYCRQLAQLCGACLDILTILSTNNIHIVNRQRCIGSYLHQRPEMVLSLTSHSIVT